MHPELLNMNARICCFHLLWFYLLHFCMYFSLLSNWLSAARKYVNLTFWTCPCQWVNNDLDHMMCERTLRCGCSVNKSLPHCQALSQGGTISSVESSFSWELMKTDFSKMWQILRKVLYILHTPWGQGGGDEKWALHYKSITIASILKC